MAGPIKIAILADAQKAKSEFASVSTSANNMATGVGDAGKRASRSIDDVGEAADGAEGKAQGFADVLTGAKDVMSGTAEIAKGNLFEGFVLVGTGMADLAGGAAQFLIPALKKSMAGMRALNLTMLANPMALVVLAIVALVAVFVIAYKKSETFRNIVNGALNGVRAVAVRVWQAIKTAAVAAWNLIKAVVSVVIGAIRAYINAYRAVVLGVWSRIRSAATAAWSAIRAAVSTAINRAKEKIGELRDKARDILVKVRGVFSINSLKSAGVNMIQGLINGIKDMAGAAISAAKGVVSDAIQGAKNLLGISSPSKVFREIGRQTTAGLALGLADTDGVKRAVRALGSTVTGGFGVDLGGFGRGGVAAGSPVTVNLNGLITDPVAAGREVEKVLNKYRVTNGRARIA